MPPKAKIPAPIDRPLSRAYLREFTGWSTAYPPGVSDSTSLRVMENMMIQRDGSIRIRPGLRYLSYKYAPGRTYLNGRYFDQPVVGSHEPFYCNDGSKAYLFAVRELSGRVGFRVLANTAQGQRVIGLTAAPAVFSVPQGQEPAVEPDDPNDYKGLNFSSDTTYVKFLQIDNKILALSDNGETMRMFTVGKTKTAKRLNAITRPDWSIEDKLQVMQPDVGWMNTGQPLTTRTNLVINPNVESNVTGWTAVTPTAPVELIRDATYAKQGTYSLRVASKPTRTNLLPNPLRDPTIAGRTGWWGARASEAPVPDAATKSLSVDFDPGPVGHAGAVSTDIIPISETHNYDFSFDLKDVTNVRRLWVRIVYFNSSGADISGTSYPNLTMTAGRKNVVSAHPPAGTFSCRIYIYTERKTATGLCQIKFNQAVFCITSEASTFFDGDSGTDYHWTGDPNASTSVYHPAANVAARTTCTTPPGTYTFSTHLRASSPKRARVDLIYNKASGVISTDTGPGVDIDEADWLRHSRTGTAPTATLSTTVNIVGLDLGFNEFIYVDCSLMEKSATLKDYFDGSSVDAPGFGYDWNGATGASTSTEKTYASGGTLPTPEARAPATLISSVPEDNQFAFAFFYTFSNEVGETAPSNITTVRCRRSWSAWRWESPNADGTPSGIDVADPTLSCDQLTATMPAEVFETAIGQGALAWNLYMYTWSNQDPTPVTAVRVATKELKPTSKHTDVGWARVTPSQSEAGGEQVSIPRSSLRVNYSDPSRGGQGIVAADRMVIVKDPTAAAVIKWTSGQLGAYTDFSSSRGGGYKTLTSGNLMIPACVKLWQNPQSADTLTILCRGVDGLNTGYYMAPSQIASQSEAVNVMGFEETTATPGTTSPYGCEVFNNALYHPLDDQLMKSTATNYNINHKSQTDMIENMWKELTDKEWIISSLHDNRLYYIVNNPAGEPLEPGCNGNEIWVFDGGSATDKSGGSWSRWMVQAHSLRKIEQGGRIYMSVIRPDGIYYFDELAGLDDYVGEDGGIYKRAIPWRMETNTQGANRAHDAWAHLQQANVTVGNFTGSMCFGVRGWNVHGQPVDVCKELHDFEAPDPGVQFDREAYFLIREDMKEWFFYAESLVDEAGADRPSYGEINLVQYRYAPVSVNVGYEYGSIETFEYGRAEHNGRAGEPDPLTTNGVPRPYVDVRRP